MHRKLKWFSHRTYSICTSQIINVLSIQQCPVSHLHTPIHQHPCHTIVPYITSTHPESSTSLSHRNVLFHIYTPGITQKCPVSHLHTPYYQYPYNTIVPCFTSTHSESSTSLSNRNAVYHIYTTPYH